METEVGLEVPRSRGAASSKLSRILIVGINYAPENIGTGKYTSEMAAWLAGRGHAVRVISAPPYYPTWQVWSGYARRWFQREHIAGVDVIRSPLWVPRVPRGLTRILHLASFGLTSSLALLWSLAWRPNVVIAIAPTFVSAPAAWVLARLSRARCWLHIQDFEIDAALNMGIVEVGPLKRFALAAERWLLRRFDKVSTISSRMIERLSAKGVPADRQVLFPNWADIDSIRPLAAVSPYRAELGIPADAVVALYSGNMGQKQGLDLLGNAAQRLRERPNLYFVFGGEGPMRETLERACDGLPNVRFLDLQPTERLNDWLGLADIHLLPQRADVADLVMPSKLTGMLASGRPVLATAPPGTGVAQVVEGCGYAVAPGDAAAFATALLRLADDRELRCTLADAARRRAEATLGSDRLLKSFEQQLFAPAGGTHLQHVVADASRPTTR